MGSFGALNYSTGDDVVDGSGAEISGSAFNRFSGLAKGTFRFGDNLDQRLRLSFSRTDSTLDDTVVAQTGDVRPPPGRPGAVAIFGTADIETRDDTFVFGYRFEPADNPWLDIDVTLSYTNTEVDKRDFSLASSCAPGLFLVLCDNDASYETWSLRAENTVDFSAGSWDNFLTFGAQALQHDADLLLRRLLLPHAPPYVLHDGLGRRFG